MYRLSTIRGGCHQLQKIETTSKAKFQHIQGSDKIAGVIQSQRSYSKTVYSVTDFHSGSKHFKHESFYSPERLTYPLNSIDGGRIRKTRIFSSYSSPTSLEMSPTSDTESPKALTKLDDMRKSTNYLLEKVPVGAFSTEDMISAITTMDFWARQRSMSGIQKATKVLERVIHEIAEGNPRADLSYDTIQMIIWSWKEISPTEFPQRSLQILKSLHRIYDHNSVPYRMFIGALTKCGTIDSAIAAEKLLDIMLDLQKNGKIKDEGSPCTITFNSILTGWERTKSKNSGQRATNILHKMIGLYRLGNDAVKPDSLSFNMTISAIVNGHHQNNSNEENASIGAEAQKIFDEMIYFHTHEDRNIKPDVSTLNNVLNAYAKSNLRESASIALDLLRKIQNLHAKKELDFLPNTISYNIVIGALSSQSNAGIRDDNSTIAKIEQLMDEMESLYTSGENKEAKVDTVTYNSLIRTWCSLNDKTKAASHADSVLEKMIALYKKGNWSVRPDNVSFNTVISAYAKLPRKDAAQKASDVLHRMQSFHDAGNSDVKPDTVSISLIITALIQSAKYGGDREMVTNQSLAILKRMENLYKSSLIYESQQQYSNMKPDAITYTSVIDCIAMSGGKGCGEQAEQILRRMEEMFYHDNMASNDLKPDTTSYNAVLRAYANSGEKGAAAKTEAFLSKMIKNYNEEKEPLSHRSNIIRVQPNVLSFGIVIDAWAKSGDRNAPQNAERLLDFMIEQSKKDPNSIFKPNAVIFSSCITAWSRSKDPKAAERASMLLKKMEDLSSSSIDHELQPNAYVYSAVFEAWSNCPNKKLIGPKVEEILKSMKTKPNVITLNTAIKAISKSHDVNKIQKSMALLDHMETNYGILPNIRTYNALLACCAATSRFPKDSDENSRMQALNTAFQLLETLRTETENMTDKKGQHKPDAYTYPAMLKVCQNLLSPLGKNEKESTTLNYIKKVVKMCCQDGMVDALFLNNIRSYVNNENQLRDLFDQDPCGSDSRLQLRSLPNEWRKHATSKKNKRFQDKYRERKR